MNTDFSLIRPAQIILFNPLHCNEKYPHSILKVIDEKSRIRSRSRIRMSVVRIRMSVVRIRTKKSRIQNTD